jgi:RNA polymerase-binding transcription factor DksA
MDLTNGVSEKNQKKNSNMAYMYDYEEERRKLLSEIKKQNELNNQIRSCAVNIGEGFYGTCARVNKDQCMPSASYLQPQMMSDKDIMLGQLGVENNKLREEKAKLIVQVNRLQEEVRHLRDENTGHIYDKMKLEKKGKFKKELSENIKKLYQDIVNWFNT